MSNLYVVVLIAGMLIVLAVSEGLETRRRDRIKRSVIEKTNAVIERQVAMLARKRMQLVQEKWSEEIRYFLIDHLRPILSREELDFFHENFAALTTATERALDKAMLDQKAAAPSANMTSR